MSISSINRIKTIANKLSSNSDAIVTIYENTGLTIGNELIADHKIISFNCFIKNLKAYASIQSLDPVSLPNFELDDSATDKLYKTLNVEWGSARKQITLYISNQLSTESSGMGWYKVGSISLLNPSGYPYRIYNLMDLFTDNLAIELGDNGKIGIQIENVGYGLLDETDTVTIHGSYVEEIFVQVPETIYIPPTGSNGSSTTQFPVSTLFRISAGDIGLNNNELINTWQQAQPSTFTVAQNDPTNQPIYRSNVINGKSAVYFDGINKFFNIQQSADPQADVTLIPSMGDWLIFMVAKFDDPVTNAFCAFSGTEILKPNITLGGNRSNVGYIDPYSNYQEFVADYSLGIGWKTYIFRRHNELIMLYIDGVLYALGSKSDSLSPYNNYLEKIIIGCNDNNSNFLSGYIAELGIMTTHSLADINAIGNYFKNLYDLTWIAV